MTVWIVVEHFDRGSDEVAVRAVFLTEADARDYIRKAFPGWAQPDEDMVGDVREGWYAEPDEPDLSDRVFIAEQEVSE